MSAAEDVGRSCLTRDNYEIEWIFLSRGKTGQFCSRLRDWIYDDTASYNPASS